MPHRTWIDPFVLALLLPIEPRLHFIGDGPTIYRSRLRRFGVDPHRRHHPDLVGSGPRGFEEHVAAARQVIDAGGVFTLFPEVGPPSALGEIRRLQPRSRLFRAAHGRPDRPAGHRRERRAVPGQAGCVCVCSIPSPPASSVAWRRKHRFPNRERLRSVTSHGGSPRSSRRSWQDRWPRSTSPPVPPAGHPEALALADDRNAPSALTGAGVRVAVDASRCGG